MIMPYRNMQVPVYLLWVFMFKEKTNKNLDNKQAWVGSYYQKTIFNKVIKYQYDSSMFDDLFILQVAQIKDQK